MFHVGLLFLLEILVVLYELLVVLSYTQDICFWQLKPFSTHPELLLDILCETTLSLDALIFSWLLLCDFASSHKL